MAGSPLATAAAISALVLAERHVDDDSLVDGPGGGHWLSGVLLRNELNELVAHALRWLASQQNEDGGWGDSVGCGSSLAATMLVEAAFHLTGVPARYSGMLERSREYTKRAGGVARLRKEFGRDRTTCGAILANYALADLTSWRKLPAVPYEQIRLPEWLRRRWPLSRPSWAAAAEGILGQAHNRHVTPRNPLKRFLRRLARPRCQAIIGQAEQPAGRFYDSVAWTSFMVMNLAALDMADHPLARRGTEFLLSTARGDGSWTLGVNQECRNTARAAIALDWELSDEREAQAAEQTLDFLLACQAQQRDALTGAECAGWSPSGQSGGLADAVATADVLKALAFYEAKWPHRRTEAIRAAAMRAWDWLLGLQNSDGGWSVFCRADRGLPSDVSRPDITARVVSGLAAWQTRSHPANGSTMRPRSAQSAPQLLPGRLVRAMTTAGEQAVSYLRQTQCEDGSWCRPGPRFAYADVPPSTVAVTRRILAALQELGAGEEPMAVRAAAWLASRRQREAGWSSDVAAPAPGERVESKKRRAAPPVACCPIETAAVLGVLRGQPSPDEAVRQAVERGEAWLMDFLETSTWGAQTRSRTDFAGFSYVDYSAPLLTMALALHRKT
jgi:squalene-hopene/tetraprenyl-beta-curcumene cyclase